MQTDLVSGNNYGQNMKLLLYEDTDHGASRWLYNVNLVM